MNCSQQIPEPCGALHSPCGEAPQQRRPLTPQHALIGFTPTPTHPLKRLAHPRSHIPPLSTLTARATHARPLLPAALASVPYRFVLVRVRVRSAMRRGAWKCIELELIQSHMAQKPVLRGEVGARALRDRLVSREEVWASAGVRDAWVSGCGCEAD